MTNKVKWQRKMPKCQLQNDTPTNFKRRQQWQSKNANCKMTMKNANCKMTMKNANCKMTRLQILREDSNDKVKMPISKWHNKIKEERAIRNY